MVVGWSDSAFANRPDKSSQGARVIALVDESFTRGQWGPATLITWDSKKLPRKVRSTPYSETQALAESVGEIDYVRAAVAEIFNGYANIHDWAEAVRTVPGVAVVDCKPTYDACVKSESSGLGLVDRHMALECISLRGKLQNTDIQLRWVHSEANPADAMTKETYIAQVPLMSMIKQSRWRLVYDPGFISSRNRTKKGMKTLDSLDDIDQNYIGKQTSSSSCPLSVTSLDGGMDLERDFDRELEESLVFGLETWRLQTIQRELEKNGVEPQAGS